MTRNNQLRPVPPEKIYTSGEITNFALRSLSLEFSAEVWRQNQLTHKGRPFHGKKGAGDITGYLTRQIPFDGKIYGKGIRIECEVKAIGDKLSEDQKLHLRQAKLSGCLCLIAYQEGYQIRIIDFDEYLSKLQK